MPEDFLVQPEFCTCKQEINPVLEVCINFEQIEIIPVLNIAFPVDFEPVFQPRIINIIATMKPFEQYRVVIF